MVRDFGKDFNFEITTNEKGEPVFTLTKSSALHMAAAITQEAATLRDEDGVVRLTIRGLKYPHEIETTPRENILCADTVHVHDTPPKATKIRFDKNPDEVAAAWTCDKCGNKGLWKYAYSIVTNGLASLAFWCPYCAHNWCSLSERPGSFVEITLGSKAEVSETHRRFVDIESGDGKNGS